MPASPLDGLNDIEPPEEMICPVCLELMKEPVTFSCHPTHNLCRQCYSSDPSGAMLTCPLCMTRGIASRNEVLERQVAKWITDKPVLRMANHIAAFSLGETEAERMEVVRFCVTDIGMKDPMQVMLQLEQRVQQRRAEESKEQRTSSAPVPESVIRPGARGAIVISSAPRDDPPRALAAAAAASATEPAERRAGAAVNVRPQASGRALIIWDFDQTLKWSNREVLGVFLALVTWLKNNGLCTTGTVETKVFTNFAAVSDRIKLKTLRDIDAEVTLTSDAKKEETDRRIEEFIHEMLKEEQERPAGTEKYTAVVLLSSDKDFNRVMHKCQMAGKVTVVIHEAPKGSDHEHLLRLYATHALRIDEIYTRSEPPLPPAAAGRASRQAGDPAHGETLSGTIISVRVDKNKKLYGAIKHDPPSDGETFVHSRMLVGGLAMTDGARVTFERVENPHRPGQFMAVNVRPLEAPIENERFTGTVLDWKLDKTGKEFCYVKPDIATPFGDQNVYAHSSSNRGAGSATMPKGSKVTFTAARNAAREGAYIATNLQLRGAPVQRAAVPAAAADPAAPAVEGRAYCGTLLKWKTDKVGHSFNFIVPDDKIFGGNVFVHISDNDDLKSSPLRSDTRVRFVAVSNRGREPPFKATSVTYI